MPFRSALWLNVVLPIVLLLGFQSFWFDEQIAKGRLPGLAGAVLFLCVYLPLFVWQWIGINRCARTGGTTGVAADAVFINGLILLAAFYVFIRQIDVMTSENSFGVPSPFAHTGLEPIPESLLIELDPADASRLIVTGVFGIAATQQLERSLQDLPGVKTVVLNSEGGNVFEARGVAKLISDQRLFTHVDGRCFSACTLAYVSGVKRTAAANASFGFHSYRLDTERPNVFINLTEQIEKDKQFLTKQGIDKTLIQMIYEVDSAELWKPSLAMLEAAGFVQRVE